MKSLGHLSSRFLFSAALVAALTAAASVLYAYHQTLDESDIMAAYNLGTTVSFGSFTADYERHFPPVAGTHISSMAIRTPFYNLVQLRHDQGMRGGHVTSANFRDEYMAHPDESFTAILFVKTPDPKATEGIDNPTSEFWKQFQFEVSQDDTIRPRELSVSLLHVVIYEDGRRTQLDSIAGGYLFMRFDAQDVPSRLIHLKATAPNGQVVTVDFDLERLK